MPQKHWLVGLGMLILNACVGHDDAPPAHEPHCATCSLSLEYVGTIGDDEDPGSPTLIEPGVARDTLGRWYILSSSTTEVMVYSPDLKYSHSVGRPGDGPGELRGAHYITVVGDSLYVFSNGRYTVFDQSGLAVRSHHLPLLAHRVHLTSEGELVVQGALRTPDGFGRPLHFIRGDTVRSFGARDSDLLAGSGPNRLSAAAEEGGYWIAKPQEYRLELWTQSGPVRHIERRPQWFEWPQQRLKAVILDLWTTQPHAVVWVSAAHTHAATRRDPTPTSIIEVLDPRSGAVLARDSVRGHQLRFANDGYVFSVDSTVSGRIIVSVWRPHFTLPQKEQQR